MSTRDEAHAWKSGPKLEARDGRLGEAWNRHAFMPDGARRWDDWLAEAAVTWLSQCAGRHVTNLKRRHGGLARGAGWWLWMCADISPSPGEHERERGGGLVEALALSQRKWSGGGAMGDLALLRWLGSMLEALWTTAPRGRDPITRRGCGASQDLCLKRHGPQNSSPHLQPSCNRPPNAHRPLSLLCAAIETFSPLSRPSNCALIVCTTQSLIISPQAAPKAAHTPPCRANTATAPSVAASNRHHCTHTTAPAATP